MKKKKVLVHGTADSLQKFFADAVSRDFEVVALLSPRPKKISITRDGKQLEAITPKNFPKVAYSLIDGIIFTDKDKSLKDYFLAQGLEPRKIILWDEQAGWGTFNGQEDGTQVIYFCGLEFHIRNKNDDNSFKRIQRYLQGQRQVKNWKPQHYPEVLAQDYQRRTGKPLDFNNLQTFTEKLQWIKIYDATPLKGRLADKYLVRNWVAEKIGKEYLIPLLGVWDDFDDIDFDALPDQFVLKCNHGWNMNVIVRDKKKLDLRGARERLNGRLAVDFGAQRALELHYSRIDRKIIAEKFMTDGGETYLNDYRFWCFNGKPIFVGFDDGSINQPTDFFDMHWNVTDIEKSDYPNSDHPELIPPPKNFELMKELVTKLAEDFVFVRVDLYEISGKVYLGEMMFTPNAGNFSYKSEGTDEYLGRLLKLPARTPPPRL